MVLDLCRLGIPHHARSVPLLRPRRLPGNVASERRPVGRGAEDRRLDRSGANRRGRPGRSGAVAARAGRLRLASGADVEPGDDDAWAIWWRCWQQNIRRLLAYSSIAHAGYMLIGIAVALAVAGGAGGTTTVDGIGAMMFYVLVYAVATLGAFALLAWLGDGERQINNVDDLAGLWRNHPWAAAVMAIFMFSLTGLPPLAGFWGKLALFLGALGIDAGGAEPSVGLRALVSGSGRCRRDQCRHLGRLLSARGVGHVLPPLAGRSRGPGWHRRGGRRRLPVPGWSSPWAAVRRVPLDAANRASQAAQSAVPARADDLPRPKTRLPASRANASHAPARPAISRLDRVAAAGADASQRAAGVDVSLRRERASRCWSRIAGAKYSEAHDPARGADGIIAWPLLGGSHFALQALSRCPDSARAAQQLVRQFCGRRPADLSGRRSAGDRLLQSGLCRLGRRARRGTDRPDVRLWSARPTSPAVTPAAGRRRPALSAAGRSGWCRRVVAACRRSMIVGELGFSPGRVFAPLGRHRGGRVFRRGARHCRTPHLLDAISGAEPSAGLLVLVDSADMRPAARRCGWRRRRSIGRPTLHAELARWRHRLAGRYRLERMVGTSSAAARVRAQVSLAAAAPASVLIVGPPGSGKEHVAKAIHYRRPPELTGALVPVACAALDAELLISTLGPWADRLPQVPIAGGRCCWAMSTLCRSKPRRPCCRCSARSALGG